MNHLGVLKPMNIYTLSAKARCGKDTAATHLMKTIPNSISYALAAGFKESIAKHFSDYMSRADVFGDGVDRNNFIIYIDSTDFEESTHKVFADFGYDLNKFPQIDLTRYDFNGWTIRRLMQVIGTDIGVNQIDSHIWLKEFESDLFRLKLIYDNVVVTDCRQPHEIEFLRGLNSTVIHIQRKTGLSDSHITERGLEPVDGEFVIDNNSTLKALYEQLDWVVNTVGIEA